MEVSTHHLSVSGKKIAEITGGVFQGNEALLFDLPGRIEYARPGSITFLAGKAYAQYLGLCRQVCVIVPESLAEQPAADQVFIRVSHPHAAFDAVIRFFYPPRTFQPGIDPAAIIHPLAQIDPKASILPGTIIEAECKIGAGSVIGPGAVLCRNTSVGMNTRVYANVTCYENTVIGNHCIIHAGAVIGSDGFGYVENKDGSYSKIHHAGRVEIHDHAEIGANTTIDRAVLGSTIIGKGVKLDNLVHIAHNVVIGDNTAIAAQTGISGSAQVGERNRFAGQVGMIGHITTAPDVIVYAQSGIARAIEKPGVYFGSPAQERASEMRRIAASLNLPELQKKMAELQQRIQQLEQNNAG
jgi:UDP-3-O-[3-hydroxymyristoyl] glucosamine N-acyltransferase